MADEEQVSPGELASVDPATRAAVLVEALPYIQAFADKVVVVKFGGNAMVDAALSRSFAADIVLLRAIGLKPVVVHGGGPQIGKVLAQLGVETEFRDGLRVTDAETLEVARMVLTGQVGADIVSAINQHDLVAVGLSGEDAGLIVASQRSEALGYVGDVVDVNRKIVDTLLRDDFIPVISTIGADATGQAFNINADSAAIAIAEALSAEKLIYLTDVPGVLTDVSDPQSLISRLSASRARLLIADGVINGGMIPKVQACLDAVDAGVGSAHILDGRIAHVALLELLTDSGVGTMITRTDGAGS
ncbi:acetylglutamate kinase [Aquihabitans sp. G128]|uniref:acetylglutamate kinase n=1 Tax=Aquihabitans sp. G128 TaxID=2849779 RepID=UPI001C21B11D|nr:acetylglutamate kinase [Aquihabitans sp. G128]QXC61924.1 acetylglutamate kinase [Aquihabitans sp. G128]